VIASFCPMILLRSVDFPAFGAPATVTIPALVIPEANPDATDQARERRTIEVLIERAIRRESMYRVKEGVPNDSSRFPRRK